MNEVRVSEVTENNGVLGGLAFADCSCVPTGDKMEKGDRMCEGTAYL